MKWPDKIIKSVKLVLPSPFSIALLLTALSIVLALWLTPSKGEGPYVFHLLSYWQTGFWELLSFTMQMALILVLGHTLALTRLFVSITGLLVKYCTNTSKAAFMVAVLTISLALFNWGIGLIFGAIFVRKIGEYAKANNLDINYPMVAAAGYSGLMVWHGGISGSAPIAVTQVNHDFVDLMGVIPLSDTVFSSLNLFAIAVLLIVIPALLYVIGKKVAPQPFSLKSITMAKQSDEAATGVEKLDASKWFGTLVGGLFLFTAIITAFVLPDKITGAFFNLNFINFTLFGLGLMLHGSIRHFITAFEIALKGAAGIIIQFPLYAGIMGIMKYSGLISVFSGFFVSISTAETLPFFTFISAGIVNLFVPSGGGQWAVQGPIVIEAAKAIGSPIAKNIMALAYGDQLTNMLQPFWALPLLGITGLKAGDILPFTFLLFILGLVIFTVSLMLF